MSKRANSENIKHSGVRQLGHNPGSITQYAHNFEQVTYIYELIFLTSKMHVNRVPHELS